SELNLSRARLSIAIGLLRIAPDGLKLVRAGDAKESQHRTKLLLHIPRVRNRPALDQLAERNSFFLDPVAAFCQSRLFPKPGLCLIVVVLKVNPESRGNAKNLLELYGSIRRDGFAAVDDSVDGLSSQAASVCKLLLCHSSLCQRLGKGLAWNDRIVRVESRRNALRHEGPQFL